MVRTEDSDQQIDLNVEPDSGVPCSICLDLVSYGGERSRAKLQCGHEFHLDCIGSAFNMKGTMQCPNCRNIEKGRWLYATGPTDFIPDMSMEDGVMDDYPVYFSFAEMPYRVQICPFRGVTHVHPSSESSVGMMSTLAPMITHQHPAGNPHPHGWVQYQHAGYHHHQQIQSSSLPMAISNGVGMPLTRNMPRFVSPPGRAYDPTAGFAPYTEVPSINFSPPAWGRDNLPHFP